MVVHISNPSIWETETGAVIRGQDELHRETHLQKKETKKKKERARDLAQWHARP